MQTTLFNKVQQLIKSGAIKLHHSALRRGYQSRKYPTLVEHYYGRFGRGYILSYPNNSNGVMSNNFHKIEYYIY